MTAVSVDPLPIPDPVAVVSWPTAAITIAAMVIAGVMQAITLVMTHQARIAATRAATQTRAHTSDDGNSESQWDVIDATRRDLAEHIADHAEWKTGDAAWKQMVESRLPPPPEPNPAT